MDETSMVVVGVKLLIWAFCNGRDPRSIGIIKELDAWLRDPETNKDKMTSAFFKAGMCSSIEEVCTKNRLALFCI